MGEKFTGNWKLEKYENLDAYMKDTNVNIAIRQVAKRLTVYLDITKLSEDEWEICYLSTFKDDKTKFKFNEKLRKTTGDGRDVWATYSIEGNKFICVEEAIKEGVTGNRIAMEVLDDGRIYETMSTIPNDVVLQRWFTPHTK